jgi:predicted HAD superfamily phosphohydrolase
MFKKSSNAPTTFGRPRLRSSAALHSYQMKRIEEFAERLCLQGVPRQAVRQVMALKSTTSPENVRRILKMYALRWFADTELFRNLDDESPMSSKECSALH